MMHNVWCVYWHGDAEDAPKYPAEYVYILRDMVARNLALPHAFRCLSDVTIPGIDCVPMQRPDFHGWWSKINLFAPGLCVGPCLYLDLDVVVTGPLDGLFHDRPQIAAPANWAQSGHGGCQSSVMAWGGECEMTRHVWRRFNYDWACSALWGDQEFLTHLLGNPGDGCLLRIPDGEVVSYKYHCRSGLPDEAKVVVFHGKPDPHEVSDPWVKQSFTRTSP